MLVEGYDRHDIMIKGLIHHKDLKLISTHHQVKGTRKHTKTGLTSLK